MTFIDFFAGIGGFRLGMERADHTCKGFIEIDKYAVKSYRTMHDTEGEFYANDIRTVKPEDLPEADCYCGGFPCQAFSIAGKRRGFEDMRGTLIFEIFRLAKVRRPKILFLENVAGLLNHDNGRTFGTIINAMAELGYDARWQCLNSKNYGVPQNRDRIFIIGHLRGAGRREIFPFSGENSSDLKQIIGGSQGLRVYDPNGISNALCGSGGGAGAKTGLYLVDLTNKNPKITDNARCLLSTYAKQDQRINTDFARSGVLEVRPCLMPGKGVANALDTSCNQGVVTCEKRIRRLIPLECFRLQGFPDKLFYKAQAVNSDSQLYKQAGNSVTVNVIYEIAKRLE